MDDQERALMIQGTELAATAAAAYAKAEIACAYEMAIRKPRNIEDVRQKILGACRRPVFAEIVEYSKPMGKSFITGPSIRFVETALQALRNVRINTSLLYEDDRIRKVGVCVTDLESNLPYTGEVVLSKTVERAYLKKGQKPISERINSKGEKTYLVEATEDDMLTKTNANVSKLIRTLGLRLIPRDIVDEAMDAAAETRKSNAKDPEGNKRKILDGFSTLGILPSQIEQYLGKKIEQVLPRDIDELRKVYTAISTGESVWSDFVEDTEPKEPEKPLSAKEKLDAKKGKPPANDPVNLSPAQATIAKLGNLGARAMARYSDKGLPMLTDEDCTKVMDIAAAIEAEDKDEKERGF